MSLNPPAAIESAAKYLGIGRMVFLFPRVGAGEEKEVFLLSIQAFPFAWRLNSGIRLANSSEFSMHKLYFD
jgi:hypothetical protein